MTTSQPITFKALIYQSGDIPLPDWISLLTLCLTPILAHIVAGAPQPTYLCRTRPSWHDRLCLYHPISIIWRYAAITDRRIRARDWCPANMAAANAIFWASTGWDGSEEMAFRSQLYCVALPDKARLSFFSWSAIKTVIVTLQGIQALVSVLGAVFDKWTVLNSGFSLDTLFFPISILGLVRLCAAFWLTDDFIYSMCDDVLLQHLADPYLSVSQSQVGSVDTRTLDRLLDSSSCIVELHFRPSSYWPSRIFRSFLIAIIFTLIVLVVFVAIPFPGYHRVFSATTCVIVSWILVALTVAFTIYTYYSIRVGYRSTIIPCASSSWYKVFSAASFVWLLIAVIFSAIETRRTPCGKYSTGADDIDITLCPGLITQEGRIGHYI